MSLILEKTGNIFDTGVISPGYLVYAKHYSWNEGIGGFVTAVTDKEIVVQYHPGIGNVTNHFIMQAQDVAAGNWEIRYSADMKDIISYPEQEADDTDNLSKQEE